MQFTPSGTFPTLVLPLFMYLVGRHTDTPLARLPNLISSGGAQPQIHLAILSAAPVSMLCGMIVYFLMS